MTPGVFVSQMYHIMIATTIATVVPNKRETTPKIVWPLVIVIPSYIVQYDIETLQGGTTSNRSI